MNHDIGIYFNWSCNQLAGDPVATDRYLVEHLDIIKSVAAFLLKRVNYKPQKIYRGIIIKEQGLIQLKPDPGFTYLSFSENESIAEIFADPLHWMAMTLQMRWGPNLYGYMIEYTPKIEEVLFHHSLLHVFPYIQTLEKTGIGAEGIGDQKEVTILQPKEPFTLKQFDHELKQKTICR